MLTNFTKVLACFLLIFILSPVAIFAAEGDATSSEVKTNNEPLKATQASGSSNMPLAKENSTNSSSSLDTSKSSTSSNQTSSVSSSSANVDVKNESTNTTNSDSLNKTTNSQQSVTKEDSSAITTDKTNNNDTSKNLSPNNDNGKNTTQANTSKDSPSTDSPMNIADTLLGTKQAMPNRRAPVANLAEISNAIDKDYSFLYDPNTKTDLVKDLTDNPDNYVIMYLETGDAVLIKLRPDFAPNTVTRFKQLVKEKYYDDMEIFRAIPDYLAQMGDPSGSGYGGKGVFYFAEINPNAKFRRGTVAMSNNGNLQSDDTQFFITFNSFDWLDGKYTIFGEVILGMNKLEKINKTLSNDGFVTDPAIVTKLELLSDRPTDRVDDLSTIIPVDKKELAIKKQEENQKKEEAKQRSLLETEKQKEALKTIKNQLSTAENKEGESAKKDKPVVDEDASVDEQTSSASSNPYLRPRGR